MAINATSNGGAKRELIPAGNYIARCYSMIHIGTVKENIMGTEKVLNKVRIGWELPTETRVFDERYGEQPLVISKEFTLSMHEKASLRIALKSWRGKDFTEDEAKCFDITKLIGVPCMLNIIHKPSKTDQTKIYEEIAGITPMPKGVSAPAQINNTLVISYDEWDEEKFDKLPDFIKQKMMSSTEYVALKNPSHKDLTQTAQPSSDEDDLPF